MRRALKNRNYRLYFLSQLLSFSGTWMQTSAQAWMVYRISHSSWWLGLVAFATQIPAFFGSPFAGAVADQGDRRRMLAWVQWALLAQALWLGGLVLTGQVTLQWILALSLVLGMINAFDMTLRQSFVIDMVGREDLPSAIALNSAMMNASRLVGPAIAGVAIELVGEGWCFIANAATYVGVIVALGLMDLAPRLPERRSAPLGTYILDGLRYLLKEPLILRLTGLMCLTAFLAPSYHALLPVFAKDVLHGNARTYAWLAGMAGAGSMIGALTVASGTISLGKKGRSLFRSMALAGLGLFVLGLSRNAWLSAAAIFLEGYSLMRLFPKMNATIQSTVRDDMRGRVMSLYTMAWIGALPMGSLALGWLSERLGAQATVAGSGLVCMLFAGGFLFSRSRRALPVARFFSARWRGWLARSPSS